MELRGHRRANKPQSGLFSRHYFNGRVVSGLSFQPGGGNQKGGRACRLETSLRCGGEALY